MTIEQYEDHVLKLRREYVRLAKLAKITESASFERNAKAAKEQWRRAEYYLKRRKAGKV